MLIFIYPIIRTVVMSFFKVESVTAPVAEWTLVGLENYVKLWNTELFRVSLWNLLRIWAIGGLFVMGLALLFAVILNSGIRFKRFFSRGHLHAQHHQRGRAGDDVAPIRV